MTPTNFNATSLSNHPLNLSLTLRSGQAFRWRQDAAGIWWGTVEKTGIAVWQAEGQPNSPLYWQTFPEPDCWDIIADYFRLEVDLEALYADWIAAEPRLADIVAAYRGLRILRQPPLECLFAFQCAACNTVVKIERSVRKLAERYGKPLSPLLSLPSSLFPLPFFELRAFPTLEALAQADEAALRADLWGYRAPRVIALARFLQTLPPGWLESLRDVSYAKAHAALSGLFGVGAKLADCICLFALDKDAAVPVDTHVRQIACRLFRPDMAGRSLTPRVYTALAETYRDRFGAYAGWAQQYLFFGELDRARDFTPRPTKERRARSDSRLRPPGTDGS